MSTRLAPPGQVTQLKDLGCFTDLDSRMLVQGQKAGLHVMPLCVCVAAGERLVGILLLYLPRVAGPEGGVPRDAGGDHQRPAAKGGVRERQAPLLSQEVTGDT